MKPDRTDALCRNTRCPGRRPKAAPKPRASDAARELAEAVLLWASTPGDHGGNPYLKPFVQIARRIVGDV